MRNFSRGQLCGESVIYKTGEAVCFSIVYRINSRAISHCTSECSVRLPAQ